MSECVHRRSFERYRGFRSQTDVLSNVCAAAAFLTQTVNLDSHVVKFEIWDTAGAVSLFALFYLFVLSSRPFFAAHRTWCRSFPGSFFTVRTGPHTCPPYKLGLVPTSPSIPSTAGRERYLSVIVFSFFSAFL